MQTELVTWITKYEAYDSLSPEYLGEQQQMVYKALCDYGALTDEEIIDRTGISYNSVRARRGELVGKGLIVPSEFKTTKSGRRAVSWVTKKY